MIPIKRIFVLLFLIMNMTAVSVRAAAPDESERAEIIELLAACADIPYYDSAETDTDELTRRVLYTCRNFQWLVDASPELAEGHNSLMLCSGEYIEAAMHTAFRVSPPRPSPAEITERRYCYSSGMYYWSGGYTRYYATEVHDITSVTELPDGRLNVVFTDTYTEADAGPLYESSTAVLARDDEGIYVVSLAMGGTAAVTAAPDAAESESVVLPLLRRHLPWIAAMLTLAAVGLVLYVFILKKHC